MTRPALFFAIGLIALAFAIAAASGCGDDLARAADVVEFTPLSSSRPVTTLDVVLISATVACAGHFLAELVRTLPPRGPWGRG